MATLALHQTRNVFLPAFRIPFARSLFALNLGFLPSAPSLQSILELFPPFLLAVPKSKTSHSRKAMRSANKGLKDKHNIVNCPACGNPKLAHNLCQNCYTFLSRMWKGKSKQDGGGGIPDMS
ncbi:ribosomal L32p protein family-domain-containing protein [Infundibulicybe gibba]|nr:ribosomal L32p protein family-domain-containing protein [Infundibulicybe gibba]